MYEPIRTKSVHSPRSTDAAVPHRTRAEELDIQLAGHLTALLTVTDELRALAPDTLLDETAQRLSAQVARLRDGRAPLRAAPSVRTGGSARVARLHQRAHALAGRALVVAESRGDGEAAELAAACVGAHAAALGLVGS